MGGRVAIELGFDVPRARSGRSRCSRRRWRGCASAVGAARASRCGRSSACCSPRRGRSSRASPARWCPAAREGWTAVGVDEFLRGYLTPRGRAAFYAAARNIYLEEPDRFWAGCASSQGEALFVWGRQDRLVPIGFARHVREALPAAEHLELDCGHVPQLEAPRGTHAAVAGVPGARARASRRWRDVPGRIAAARRQRRLASRGLPQRTRRRRHDVS